MFISQYVLGTSAPLDYMQTFYPAGGKDFHFVESITAVWLAFFCNQTLSSSLLHTARKTYGRALSLTKNALQSPESVTKDTTLLTVLLLHLFECLATKDEYSSLESNMTHIDGAIALIKLRGKEQFRDAIGLRMFLQLSLNILVQSLHREVEFPAEFVSLRIYASQFGGANDMKWQFTDLMVRYARLRSAIRLGECPNSEIIQVAKQIDCELLDICTNMPPDWEPVKASPPIQSTTAFLEHCHVYSSHNIRKTWNTIRLVRILVNEVIPEYSQKGFAKETFSAAFNQPSQEASSTIRALLSDICASVPPYNKEDIEVHLDRAAAHSLIFPLYIVASSASCSRDMRDWIIGKLEFIGSQMCIPHSIMVKEMLDGRKRGNPWGVAAMLGGAPILLITPVLSEFREKQPIPRILTSQELDQTRTSSSSSA